MRRRARTKVYPRHRERSEAIHSYHVKQRWIASSLALLAMTIHEDVYPRSRGADRARVMPWKIPPSHQRAQGMPGAWCARSRACSVESTRVSHHGHTGNTRHSPRNGFNGFLRALPGDRAFLPPSPLRSLLPRNLMPASGHQDHTTSPSALPPLVLRRQSVHRIPHQRP
jgi:hypothetical protein